MAAGSAAVGSADLAAADSEAAEPRAPGEAMLLHRTSFSFSSNRLGLACFDRHAGLDKILSVRMQLAEIDAKMMNEIFATELFN